MLRPWFKILIAIVAAFFLIWLTGFFIFLHEIYNYRSDLKETEAIVILTGGRGRLNTGIDLLKQDKSESLFISGVHKGVSIEEISEDVDLSDHITLGYLAQSTLENAKETASWVRENGFESIRLVTSFYHMPRSLLEFKHILPEVKIVPHAVVHERFKEKSWLQDISILQLFLSEYNKYLLMSLRISLGWKI
jgi:uncharacterized SAM-binding protein YcdF (DUF218 family)